MNKIIAIGIVLAMLACRRPADVLKEFHEVEMSMVNTGQRVEKYIDELLDTLENDYKSNPEEVGAYYKNALKADSISDQFITYINELKLEVENSAGGRRNDKNLNDNINISSHANLFITDGEGKRLKQLINTTRESLLSVLDSAKRKTIMSDLIAKDNEHVGQPWEEELFLHTPAAAVGTLLEKFKNDALNTEAQVLKALIASYK